MLGGRQSPAPRQVDLESLPVSELERLLSDEEALLKFKAEWLKSTQAAQVGQVYLGFADHIVECERVDSAASGGNKLGDIGHLNPVVQGLGCTPHVLSPRSGSRGDPEAERGLGSGEPLNAGGH